MKVVLAEKPSVARDIAAELGATSRKEGYLHGNGWAVTWAFGHMVELKEPEEYDAAYKRWTVEDLPIVPEKFLLRPRKDTSARAQLEIIRTLFKDADEIICATDAGREGELIFRYIQEWAKVRKKPFKRLWISSLTPEAIQKGFRTLADGKQYDNLYRAARCRSESDWIVGMNATRYFTVRYGARGMLWSLGRVQTPVLAMIVGRDLEIESFKPEDYWEVHTHYRTALFKHTKGRFADQEKARAVIDKIKGEDLVITGLQERDERIPPPLLYDLTSLQKDMNTRFGLTADQTLKLAQALYEKKHLTYPRTDSRYLTTDLKAEIPKRLESLRAVRPDDIAPLDLENLNFTKRIIQDAKVNDHHAIIPTEVLAGNLSGDEQKVYTAVVLQFIAAFYPPCLKKATTVHAEVQAEKFKASGKVLVDPGWQAVYKRKVDPDKPAKKKEEDQELPAFEKGEAGPHEPLIATRKTKPPKRFNEATLLQMMETAGKVVKEEALREALKEKGIGTPATRAAIIETLLQRNYIRREKKNLISTEGGRHLIGLVQDPQLKSPEMTGDWEARLKAIEAGKFDPDEFMQKVVEHTRTILGQAAEKKLGPCPKCGEAVIKGRQHYGCSGWEKGCTFVINQDKLGLQLSAGQVSELLFCKKSMRPMMLEEAGAKRFVRMRMEPDGQIVLEDQETPKGDAAKGIGVCPVCVGAVLESPKAWSCSNWRNGCPFQVWKTMAGKKIPKTAVKQLLANGKSDLIEGFKSRAGKPFKARLQVVEGEVKFAFDD